MSLYPHAHLRLSLDFPHHPIPWMWWSCVRASSWVLSPDWCRPKISPRPFGNLERDEDGLFDACSVLLLLTTPSSARVEIGFATRAKYIWPIKTTVSVGLGLGLVRTKLAISSLHTPRKQMQCLLIGIMRWLKWMKCEGGGGLELPLSIDEAKDFSIHLHVWSLLRFFFRMFPWFYY